MIFGKLNPKKNFWHENFTVLSTHMSHLPWKIQKVIFNSIIHTYFWLFTLSQKKTNCNPLAHPTWNVTTLTCEMQNFFIWLKVYCVLSNVGGFEDRATVVGCRRWLWKEPAVMCDNWNVKQATSQQVFRVTTFCVNTCFKSFSTLITRIVHHVVLKFSPCRNKPLTQASTCPNQYTRSYCSETQTQYTAMQIIGSTIQQ